MSSVLYDTPGPRARRRNVLYTVGFLLVFGAALVVVLTAMADKGQLDADKWTPFVTDGGMWTTFLLPGLAETLKAAAAAIVIALPLGALLGIGRLSDHTWVRVPVGAVVEFFRSIPVLMLMLFGFALLVRFTDISSDLRPFCAVVAGLVLYNASVIAEIVRAGIHSLPGGQTDAAKAIGMRKGQSMRYVLLPQAVTVMLPALVGQLVVILKDTALGGALLGVEDLLSAYQTIPANYGANTIAALVVIAAVYIAVNFALTACASRLEARLRTSKRTAAGVGDVTPEEAALLAGPAPSGVSSGS